jgi:hypothetical protein
MAKSENDQFQERVQNIFAAIFSYHFDRKPVLSERQTPFGNYVSIKYRAASGSPLALLLTEGLVAEPTAFEILTKNRLKKEIDDLDLESVIHGIRQEKSTVFVLASDGEFERDDFDRLFRVFSRHLVIVLPLGKDDLARLEKYVKGGNINACLIVFFQLTNRVTTDPWDEKMMQRHGGYFANQKEWQDKATAARLDGMAKLDSPQLRTLIKKLHFLMSFEKSGNEISKACEAVKISRKTFYLWMENDPIFKSLMEAV